MTCERERLDPAVGERLLQGVQHSVVTNGLVKLRARNTYEVTCSLIQQLPLVVVESLVAREDLWTLAIFFEELRCSAGPFVCVRAIPNGTCYGLTSECSYHRRSA